MIVKKTAYWIPLSVLTLFGLYQSLSFSLHDFGNYYFASYFFLKGQFDASFYEPLVLNSKVAAEGYSDLFLGFAPNTPITSLLFLPFTFLSSTSAKIVFNLLSIALFILSWIRLCRHLKIPDAYRAVLPLIFALPIYNNILFGQVYFILFTLLAEGYLAQQRGHNLLCALFWAIAIVFKITPGILLLYLLFKKEYKLLFLVSSVCTALLSLALLLNGWDIWRFYITEILPRANQGDATAAAFTINYQSAYMALKYLFVEDALDNPAPILNSLFIFQICVLIFRLVIITLAASYTIHSKSNFSPWAVWIVASLLFSPYGSSYSYIILIIPMLVLHEKKNFIIMALLCTLLINIPITLLYNLPGYLQFPRLCATLIIFISMVAQESPALNRQLIIPISLMTILMAISAAVSISSPLDSSSYLLKTHNHPVVMSYKVDDGFINYSYWTPAGILEEQTNIEASSLSFDPVKIVDNEILYRGKVLVPKGKDKKLKASVLNDSTVIYLSDKGRGYGFYAFRKFSLINQ